MMRSPRVPNDPRAKKIWTSVIPPLKETALSHDASIRSTSPLYPRPVSDRQNRDWLELPPCGEDKHVSSQDQTGEGSLNSVR